MRKGSFDNWEFDGFTVMKALRSLTASGRPVPLTSKAFDTLVVLIENRDRVVTKDELLRSVWPDVEVEEGNLTQQIFLLRKAFGETAQRPRYIVTIPGHGYRFTAQVTAISDDSAAAAVLTNAAASPPAAPRRRLVFIAIGLAALGGVLLIGIALGSRWMRLQKAAAPVGFRSMTKITDSGKATVSAISRDGRYIAYVENDGDEYSLWLKQAGTDGKHQVMPRQPLELAHVSFTADGEYIYFARRSPRSPMFILYRVPTIGGLESPVLEDVDSPVSFSPDGREFVFQRGAGSESHIVAAAAGGGTQRILAIRKFPVRFSESAPDWSPDGKAVAAVVIDGNNTSQSIVLLPLDRGATREIYRTTDRLGRLRWLPDGSGLLTVASDRLQQRHFDRLLGGAIWRIGYPSGQAERLTFDVTNHDPCCLDIGANGSVVANVINTVVSDLSITPVGRLAPRTQITWDHPVLSRHTWLTDNDTVVYRDSTGRLNAIRKDNRAFSLPLPDGEKVAGGVSACGDGRYVVFSTLPGRKIWRVAPNAGGPVKLTNGFDDFNPACSPDGKWVLYASRERDHVSLWSVSIEGGKSTPLNLIDSYDVLPSPSGRMIYYSTDHVRTSLDQWVVMSATAHTPLFTFDVPGNATRGTLPMWAPDDSGLDYVVTRSGVSNIWRQPVPRGQPVQITQFSMGQIFSFAWSPDGRWLSLASGVSRSDVVLMTNQR